MTGAQRAAYVVGTFDTKGDELRFIAERIAAQSVAVVRVERAPVVRSTSGAQPAANKKSEAIQVVRMRAA